MAYDETAAKVIAENEELRREVELLREENADLRRKVEALEKDAAPTQAAADVLAERRRQVDAEGWRPEHDDEHHNGEMAQAAAFYSLYDLGAMSSATQVPGLGGFLWPWSQRWLKPKDRRHNLVRAAALLLAEIERLDRAALASTERVMERPAILDAIINAHGAPGGPIEEIRAYISALEKDAARYRWLRECSPMSSAHGAVTVNWPKFRNGRLIDGERRLCLDELDAAIDAALAAEKRGGE